jgi:predicted MFS family arabinose efflux permease
LAGFALGGLAVAAVGTRAALAIDAATFFASAIVIRIGVRARPPAHVHSPSDNSRPSWFNGAAEVFRDHRLRQLVGLAWVLGILVVPEGLAAPYARLLGGGARTVGVLLAALPAGVLVGSVIYARCLSPATRAILVGPLAVGAGIPLIVCAATPALPLTMILWAVSGLCTAYQIQVVTEFVQTIAPRIRGQGISLASGGLLAAQGIGLVAGGAVAELTSPGTAIAAAGATATVLAAGLALARRRGEARSGEQAASAPT